MDAVTGQNLTTTLAGSEAAGFADGDSTVALFNEPMGVAVKDDYLYVADSANHAIRKVSMSGAVTTFCGSQSDGDTWTAVSGFRDGTSALFDLPYGVTFDTNGILYVADSGNYAVRAVSPLGVVATLVGKRSSRRGYIDDYLALSAFDVVTDLVYFDNSLYVVDSGNYAVRSVTLPHLPLFPLVEMTSCSLPESCEASISALSSCSVPDACSASSIALTIAEPSVSIVSQFELTYALDSYYIATVTPPDANYFVTVRFSSFVTESSFDVVSLYDGDTLLASSLSGGSSRPLVSGSCGNAVAVRFVSDSTDTDTGIAFTASLSSCATRRRLSADDDDSSSQLESADDPSVSGYVTTIAGSPYYGYYSVDGVGTNAVFYIPFGIGATSDGFLFVSDQGGGYDESGSDDYAAASQADFIRFITPAGRVTTLAGRVDAGISIPTDGEGTNAVFSNPCGLAVDSDGSVYVADANYPAIRRISVVGGGWGSETPTPSATPSHSPSPTPTPPVRQINGNMAALVNTIAGLPVGSYGAYIDGVGREAAFDFPWDVAFNSSSSNAIVSECNNNVLRSISSNGTVTTVAGNGRARLRDGSALFASMSCPAGVDFDDKGLLYIADYGNNAIRAFSSSSGKLTTFAGRARAGFIDGASALFKEPNDVAFFGYSNSSTFLLVADSGNNAIRALSTTGSTLTLAGSANFGFLDGPMQRALFHYPYGLAADISARIVYVADFYNNAIRSLNVERGMVTTLVGSPTSAGYKDGLASTALLEHPLAVMVVADYVYFTDQASNSVRAVQRTENDATRSVSTIAGAGVSGFSDGYGPYAYFNLPAGMALNGTGAMFVVDVMNNAVRTLILMTPSPSSTMSSTLTPTASPTPSVSPTVSSTRTPSQTATVGSVTAFGMVSLSQLAATLYSSTGNLTASAVTSILQVLNAAVSNNGCDDCVVRLVSYTFTDASGAVGFSNFRRRLSSGAVFTITYSVTSTDAGAVAATTTASSPAFNAALVAGLTSVFPNVAVSGLSKASPSQSASTGTSFVTIAGAVVGSVVVLILLFLIRLQYERSQNFKLSIRRALSLRIPTSAGDEVINWSELVPDAEFQGIEGGMGIVHKAVWMHRDSMSDVAVKIIKMGSLSAGRQIAELDKAISSLEQEAALLCAALDGGRNESVVATYGTVHGTPTQAWLDHLGPLASKVLAKDRKELIGIVMRFEAGGTLGHLLHGSEVSWVANTATRIHMIEKIVSGVSIMHNLKPGIIHADIKPDNVLLSSSRDPRLTDFGLATLADESTGIAAVSGRGTPPYMAPELFSNFGVDSKGGEKLIRAVRASPSTDVFALATLAWEVLCSAKPWDGISDDARLRAQRSGKTLDWDLIPPDVPEKLRALLVRAVGLEPDQRPTAAALRKELKEAREQIEAGKFDVFLSHQWTTDAAGKGCHAAITTRVHKLLRDTAKCHVWIDLVEMGHDMKTHMEEGVLNSAVVVALVSRSYAARPNCMLELRTAQSLKKPIITVLVDEDENWWPSDTNESEAERELASIINLRASMAINLRGPDRRKHVSDAPVDPMELKTLVKLVNERLGRNKVLTQSSSGFSQTQSRSSRGPASVLSSPDDVTVAPLSEAKQNDAATILQRALLRAQRAKKYSPP